MKLFQFFFVSLSFSCLSAERLEVAITPDHKELLQTEGGYASAWQLFVRAAARTNIVVIENAGNWEGNMRRLKSGKVKLLFGAVYTDERAKWASYSLPLSHGGSSIFSSLDNPITSHEQIDKNTAKIAVQKGSIQEQKIREMGFINIYQISNIEQIFDMLQKKRIDYFVETFTHPQYFCESFEGLSNECIKVVGKPIMETSMHTIALKSDSKTSAQLKAINRQLLFLFDNDMVQAIFEQNKVPENTKLMADKIQSMMEQHPNTFL